MACGAGTCGRPPLGMIAACLPARRRVGRSHPLFTITTVASAPSCKQVLFTAPELIYYRINPFRDRK